MMAVQMREQQAYACLLDRHLDGLHAYVFRYCQNASDAEDITQETFLKIWNQAYSWQPNRVKFTTWLYRIAHNLCVDLHRKHRPVAPEHEEIASPEMSHSDALVAQERQNLTRQAIHALPARQRDAILLCNLQGASNKQAAEILEISVQALESLLTWSGDA